MSEIKITVEIPGLSEAINALAAAVTSKTPCTSNIGPGTEATAAPAPVAPAIPPQMPQAPTAAPVPTSYPAAPQMPTQPVPTAPSMPAPAPVSAPASAPSNAPTIEALSNAGAALCEKGMMPQLIGLLGKYGCQAITQLKPEFIPAFAAELRALGAAI